MPDKHISDIITQVCTQYGIDYQSKNPSYVAFCTDARRLGTLYLQLKLIASELSEISERHNLNGLQQLLTDDIAELDRLEHDLIRAAKKITEESKNE